MIYKNKELDHNHGVRIKKNYFDSLFLFINVSDMFLQESSQLSNVLEGLGSLESH